MHAHTYKITRIRVGLWSIEININPLNAPYHFCLFVCFAWNFLIASSVKQLFDFLQSSIHCKNVALTAAFFSLHRALIFISNSSSGFTWYWIIHSPKVFPSGSTWLARFPRVLQTSKEKHSIPKTDIPKPSMHTLLRCSIQFVLNFRTF